ncbi:OmpA family protein [Gilvimarinus xylanilyticus]|uniref:OmpA family protein n=1 Tax=Gilvimarinus xylanilyticus TaxID=2944139 RepID=A0A9X2I4B4_9GAMM|nr:OmpA family protein [Gilvimarinus xylanilyticus]MCP8900110.1 OmpA family protein [Gilvimarinus xylanilyticus]
MLKRTLASSSILALVIASGCATTQEPDDRLERLRDQYAMVSTTEEASEYAPVQLEEAEEAIDKLEAMLNADAKPQQVQHQVYLVERKLQVATQTARMNEADEMVENAGERRNKLLLDARTQRAEQAEARARMAQEEAKSAQEQAKAAQQEALAAQARADEMSERAKKLERDLENISTQETDRGLVLTLGNILFEVDKSTIKQGSQRTLERVAGFLNEYPDRDVMIEGFTDSTGSEDYNQDLSQRRARSVKDTLVNNGVTSARIKTRGYGESHPVASNDTSAGRLQNRRVEIVIGKAGEAVQERR